MNQSDMVGHRIVRCLLSIVGTIVFASCLRIGDRDLRTVSFLPGECLMGDQLSLYIQDDGRSYGTEDFSKPATLYYVLTPDLKSEYVTISQWQNIFGWLPQNSVFGLFGSQSESVRNDFYSIFDNSFRKSTDIPKTSTITIYFSEADVLITADAEICGTPAGENLYPTVFNIVTHNTPVPFSYFLPLSSIPDGYIPIDETIPIRTVLGDHEIVKQRVNYHVEIPVKVGMYLHYLNDKHSDPEAQMQYRDEVLTCDFISEVGIR